MHVQNLGRKSVEEIKQKLVEIKEHTAVVPLMAPSYMDMLHELIGLEDVKEQIKKNCSFRKDEEGSGSRWKRRSVKAAVTAAAFVPLESTSI